MDVLKDIAYRQVDNLTLHLDIYRPATPPPHPTVLCIHGGSWRAYDKSHWNGAWLTEHGFALVVVDYRKSQQAIFPAQIHDCKAAVRWIRANARQYNLATDRLGAWGTSAGGHLAALLGTTPAPRNSPGSVCANAQLEGEGDHRDQSSAVQAVCAVAAPLDFLHVKELYERRPGKSPDPPGKEPLRMLLGGTVDDKPNLARLASPIEHVASSAANLPPFLLIHPDPDLLVPTSQSRRMHEALQAVGARSELRIIYHADHGPEITRRERDAIVRFFNQHVK